MCIACEASLPVILSLSTITLYESVPLNMMEPSGMTVKRFGKNNTKHIIECIYTRTIITRLPIRTLQLISSPSLPPFHPPPNHLIHGLNPLPIPPDLKPLPMLLPTILAIPLDPLIRQLDMDESFHLMSVGDFAGYTTVIRRRRTRS